MKKSTIILGVIIILAILLVWGLIGSSEAAKIEINCDIGIGDDGSALCWKWHQNTLGDIREVINQVINK